MQIASRSEAIGPLQHQQVDELAVYTQDGQLVAVYWERPDGTLASSRAGDPDFARICADLLIKQTVRRVVVSA